MPLVSCPECGKEVSSQAASCPQCGHPIAAESGPFGSRRPGVTVRPGFWHDPNVGAIAALILVAVVALLILVF